MTSCPSRVLPAAVLVATIAACAHGQREAAQTPDPSPPRPSTVTSEDIARQPGMSLEQLLAGRIAGVRVTRAPGGGIAVQIRGPTSLSLSNAPLYVVERHSELDQSVRHRFDRGGEGPRRHRDVWGARRQRRHRHHDEAAVTRATGAAPTAPSRTWPPAWASWKASR